MDKCPVCKEEKKGKYWCSGCQTVFVCPHPNCAKTVRKRGAKECPECGLFFEDYMERRKMYRRCPKCKVIKRHGRVMVICSNPKHKQRQG